MKIETQEIGPALAQKMLACNTANRPLSKRHVELLAERILRGEWQLNGDAIRFAGGVLVDGQHRLSAIVLANKAIKSLVIYDLPQEVFSTIDTGKVRSPADYFALKRVPNYGLVVSGLRWVDAYLTGRTSTLPRYSNDELWALYLAHPDIAESATFSNRSAKVISNTLATASHYLFARVDRELADTFFTRLGDGFGIEKGDALGLLRNKLLADRAAKARLPMHYLFALTIKAWNYERKGKRIAKLYLQEGETRAENFPVIE